LFGPPPDEVIGPWATLPWDPSEIEERAKTVRIAAVSKRVVERRVGEKASASRRRSESSVDEPVIRREKESGDINRRRL